MIVTPSLPEEATSAEVAFLCLLGFSLGLMYGFKSELRQSVSRRSAVQNVCGSLWRASLRWNNAECVDLSAAFAYYVLQSFFPLLLIALSVAVRVFGQTDSLDNVLDAVQPVLPSSAFALVDTTLRGLVAQGFGAGLLGVVVLLLTASNAYLTLQRGADRLWSEILPAPTLSLSLFKQVVQFCRNRVEAFLTVLGISFLIVVEQVLIGIRQLPEEILNSIDQILPGTMALVGSTPILPLGRILLPALLLSLMALLLQRVLTHATCSFGAPASGFSSDRIWLVIPEYCFEFKYRFFGKSLSGLWGHWWCSRVDVLGLARGSDCVFRSVSQR